MNDPWKQRVRAALGVEALGEDGPRVVADVDPKHWHEAVRACRDEVGCDFFDWLSAVDEGSGFRIVAHLWSVAERRGVLLRALLIEGSQASPEPVQEAQEQASPAQLVGGSQAPPEQPVGGFQAPPKVLAEGAVDSVVDLYPGADWHERETHEMFGVDFPGHPGLEPLLLAPEFEGHPLRKDFVLASRVVKPWPGAKEPGEGHGTVRKRAPKRPPGVPENWMEPEAEKSAQGDAPDSAANGASSRATSEVERRGVARGEARKRAVAAPDTDNPDTAEPGGADGA